MKIFETFKPKVQFLQKYISYYYLDIADNTDYFNQYCCYPHFNNTLSFYKSHVCEFDEQHVIVRYDSEVEPLQIFTPLRENVWKVNQKGTVHKIAIVFHPFGINQFVDQEFLINKVQTSPDFEFFKDQELKQLFSLKDPVAIAEFLDEKLTTLFKPVENNYVRKALQLFHEEGSGSTIDELAVKKLGIGRKQLTRLFHQYLGVSPHKYRSIVRFRQLMAYKLHQTNRHNLGLLSHQAHYTDQSHFIKACKQLTGLTPSRFFKDGKIVGSEDTFWKFS